MTKPKSGLAGRVRRLWQSYQTDMAERRRRAAEIERLVDIADPTIRRAKGYRRILHDRVGGVVSYCSSVIDLFPGPIRLSRNDYFDDPVVKALFVSADDLAIQRQSIFLDWANVLQDNRLERGGQEIVMAELALSAELRRYGIFVIFSID